MNANLLDLDVIPRYCFMTTLSRTAIGPGPVAAAADPGALQEGPNRPRVFGVKVPAADAGERGRPVPASDWAGHAPPHLVPNCLEYSSRRRRPRGLSTLHPYAPSRVLLHAGFVEKGLIVVGYPCIRAAGLTKAGLAVNHGKPCLET
jgi:hypothetical protein